MFKLKQHIHRHFQSFTLVDFHDKAKFVHRIHCTHLPQQNRFMRFNDSHRQQ